MGQRVGLLLAMQGAEVRLASRQADRARAAAEAIKAKSPGAAIEGVAGELGTLIAGCQVVIAAGAAGVVLLPRAVRLASKDLKVVIDLNAFPPLGVEGVEVADRGKERDGAVCYGAIGVGDTKMKLHRRAVAALFERNDHVMDAAEVYALGDGL